MFWQMRLGHDSLKALENIDYLNLAKNKTLDVGDSPICPKVKIIRNPFPISSSRADVIFDLVHVDLWGLYHTPTHVNKHFFLTVMDDVLGVTWIQLMQFKYDVIVVLEAYITMIET